MTQRPNFLFIITDQQRADHLGAYGNREVRTPHLDGLAARAWVADRYFVATPICMPNRASLLTGRMPSVHGVRSNGIPLSRRATTFVDVLREAGYRTALVGKSHLQNMTGKPALWPAPHERPARQAWPPEPGTYDDEWAPRWRDDPAAEVRLPFYGFEAVDLVIDHGDTAGGHYRRWLEREHPDVAAVTGPDPALASDYALVQARQAWRTRVPEALSTTSWIAERTMARLRTAAGSAQPFFIQCSFPDPHHPFTPPGRFWDMYDPASVALPASFHYRGERPPHVAWLHAQRDAGKAVKHTPAVFACTEREAREAIALNYGSISHIDDAIGRILASLQALGLAENTVVVFTSDHGDYFGEHQLLWKGPLHYDSVVRVPFLWADPAAPAGRSDTLCSALDLAPTILQRASVEPFFGIQGRSLLPHVRRDGDAPRRDAVLIEEEGQRVMFGLPGRVRMRTLRTADWRLSLYDGVDWGELYDLRADPHECVNRWDDPACVPMRAELALRLAREQLALTETSPYASALA
ncbi:sulfatase-like hydrolase/transferase [Verticiella sediminum]|uniref:Sulfatase-like hydrolase/transferase n=1 Tax=Verticiella sediminum TaxID=1247510 RepID=A0A556B077_9BURK|nr:sulfatase-like hydrolase/transferase [Verticiella sediminum]TSH98583.1 sulfatase-like hydrolase/transferase [Verticiella sediminum]